MNNIIQLLTLCVAIVGLGLSYYFEEKAYSLLMPNHYFFGAALSVLLAFVFNAFKFTLIWMTNIHKDSLRRFQSLTIRNLIFLNSMLCSLLVFGLSFYEPNMDSLIFERKAEINRAFDAKKFYEITVFESEKQNLDAHFNALQKKVSEDFLPRIQRYEALRQVEMSNVKNGTFIGDRYKEFDRFLSTEKDNLNNALSKLIEQQRMEHQKLRQAHDKRLQQIEKELTAQLNNVTRENLHGQEDAQIPAVVALLNLLNPLLNTTLQAMHISLIMSLLATIMIEFSPIMLIGYVASDFVRHDKNRTVNTSQPSSNKIVNFIKKQRGAVNASS